MFRNFSWEGGVFEVIDQFGEIVTALISNLIYLEMAMVVAAAAVL